MRMPDINWDEVFEEHIERRLGASEAEIDEFIKIVGQPLSHDEIAQLHQRNVAHPESWILPSGPLPESYLSFLRWSNGGHFRNGDRLMHFFPVLNEDVGVRVMMLLYQMPERCPGVLPIAFNGGGIFYELDMRFRSVEGEYGIVANECGHESGPFKLEPTFLEACQSRISIETLWDEEDEITRPMCDECGEYLICPECG